MALKKKIDFRKTKRILVDGSVKRLRAESLNMLSGIESRTLQGRDVQLRSFSKYSKAYRLYRSKHGRTSRVNLTYTGKMLGAMTTSKIVNGLRFKFMSSTETKKAYYNQIKNKREFFGIDKKMIIALKKRISKL